MHVQDLSRFLAELKENNNRPWFVMNKPRYDILREEFLQLVGQLIVKLGKIDPEVAHCDAKKAMFRINRDVRFGADKSPYKTNFSASIVPTGRKKPSEGGGPAYYFHIDAQGKLFIAAGEYMPPAPRVLLVRQQIVKDPHGFAAMLKNKKFKAQFGDLQREHELARPPKGFAADSPHMHYLKLKDFIVWREFDLTARGSEELLTQLLEIFKDALPLIHWLRSAPLVAEA